MNPEFVDLVEIWAKERSYEAVVGQSISSGISPWNLGSKYIVMTVPGGTVTVFNNGEYYTSCVDGTTGRFNYGQRLKIHNPDMFAELEQVIKDMRA